MKIRRIINPEISPNPDSTGGESLIRRIGGNTLALMGYGMGVLSFSGIGVTGGASLPVFGAISAGLFAGSRAILRPAYQNSSDYESVKQEDFGDKAKRIGVYVGGIAVANAGINMLTGGIFNSYEGISLNPVGRGISIVAGYFATKYGFRATRASFDPQLLSETEPIESRQPSLWQTAKESMKDGFADGRERAQRSKIKNDEKIEKIRMLGNDLHTKIQKLFEDARNDQSIDLSAELDRLRTEYRHESDAILRPADQTVVY